MVETPSTTIYHLPSTIYYVAYKILTWPGSTRLGIGIGWHLQSAITFTPAIVKISHKRKLHQKDIVISMSSQGAGVTAVAVAGAAK